MTSTCVAYGVPSLITRDFALQFLGNVVGFNMTDYRIVSFKVGPTYAMPDSHHYITPMQAVISNYSNDTVFTATFEFVDGKMWSYTLDGEFGNGTLTAYDCLPIANRSLVGYRALLNDTDYEKAAEMLSTAINTRTLRVEDENSCLQISYVDNCSTASDYRLYTSLTYTTKIDGVTIPMEGLSLSISKNGLLTWLGDGSMYHVVSTAVEVSEGEAVNMSSSYAEAYASQHGQKITSINATFEFARDWGCVRGNDDFAIYPLWSVLVKFDRVNDENVLTYNVAIWADSGQIYNNAAQPLGGLSPMEDSNPGISCQFVAIVVMILLLLPAVGVYLKKKSRNRGNNR
jgi:hypothetical protein